MNYPSGSSNAAAGSSSRTSSSHPNAHQNIQNGSTTSNGSPGNSAGPSSSNQSAAAPKRKLTMAERLAKRLNLPEREIGPERNVVGPLYQRSSDSIVLYEPPEEDSYHPDSNPNGFVEVIVCPDLQNGRDGNLAMKQEQKDGLLFLWRSFSTKKGVILAHEMGLGKTRTAIAFLYTLLEQSKESRSKSTPAVKKIMVLAPKNAIATWEKELEKWCPANTKVNHQSIYTTTKRPDKNLKILEDFEDTDETQIIILSYDSFKKYRDVFYDYKVTIDIVVCDEAHLLKNDMTQRSQNLGRLTAKFWMGLTGTPFQNNLEEFCNLITFFEPGILGENYKQNYCRQIQNVLNKHKHLTFQTACLFYEMKNKISSVIQYKKNVISVDKHEMIVCIGLKGNNNDEIDEEEKIQHKMYEALVKNYEIINNAEGRSALLVAQQIDILKKLCIHPEYAFKTVEDHYCLNEVIQLYNENYEESRGQDGFTQDGYLLMFSGKLYALFMLLKTIKERSPGEKVVVVSYSTEILTYIEKIYKSDTARQLGFNSRKLLRFDGGTDELDRKRVLEKFDEDDDCFLLLLSGKAGGTALNLTRANHLILMDPDWNPSNDKQVLARIYRPGQTRTVYTYRFLLTGTIEEKIFLNQLAKAEVGELLEADVDKNLHLPFDDKDLLTYHSHTNSYLNDVLTNLRQLRDASLPTPPEIIGNFEIFNSENMPRKYFAQELSCARVYDSKEAVTGQELEVFKATWDDLDKDITFAFHKTKLANMEINTIGGGLLSMLGMNPLQVRVKKPEESVLLKNDTKIYPIRSDPKGVVLIINNKNYLICEDGSNVEDPNDSDLQRDGSEYDVGYVFELFEQMGYKVIIKEDLLNKEALAHQLEKFKREIRSLKPDIALVFLMGHGTNDGLLMIDGEIAHVWLEIIYQFTNQVFPEMKGKPKGFFFQSCQDYRNLDLPEGDEKLKVNPTDIIVSMAAPPGCKAHRSESIGSFYIYKLVDILMNNSWNCNLQEMLNMLRDEMTKLSQDNEDLMQIPAYQEFLTKNIHLI